MNINNSILIWEILFPHDNSGDYSEVTEIIYRNKKLNPRLGHPISFIKEHVKYKLYQKIDYIGDTQTYSYFIEFENEKDLLAFKLTGPDTIYE